MKTTKNNITKTLLAAALLISPAAAQADDYAYLAFQRADSTCTSLNVESLEMTFDAQGNLIATNGQGTCQMTVADLARMYFTNTPTTTAISAATQTATGNTVEVYTLAGTRLGTFATEADVKRCAPKGIYLVKANGQTLKMTVR